jgi:mono/diheme cytochrome c family protein
MSQGQRDKPEHKHHQLTARCSGHGQRRLKSVQRFDPAHGVGAFAFVHARTWTLVLALTVLPLIGGCRTEKGDTSDGRQIAEQWCSECHRVEPDQPSGARPGHVLPPTMAAPSFMAIASRPGVDAEWLRRFADELHLPMPIYRLPPAQQDKVINYILTLRPAPTASASSGGPGGP